jgi:hypothetical protein
VPPGCHTQHHNDQQEAVPCSTTLGGLQLQVISSAGTPWPALAAGLLGQRCPSWVGLTVRPVAGHAYALYQGGSL